MKFSITIPAYKHQYLKECIDSCLAQTYDDFELVIVNDHSPEDLDTIVKKYDDPRIHYYVNEQNCGAVNVVDNWNKCLEYAKGDYIICMGDDDKLLPCCLDEYNRLIGKYPGLSVYHAWTEIISENSNVFMYQEQRPEYEGAYSFLYHRWNFRFWQFIGDFCFKTDRLREQGGFYKLPLAWTSDDITVFRAALDGGIANTQVPCFQYRNNGQTISSTGSCEKKMEAARLAKEYYVRELSEFKLQKSSCVYNTEKIFYELVKRKVKSHFRNRFFITFNEALKTKNPQYRFWINEGPKFGVSKHDVLKEIYNYYISKLLHIGNSY